MKEGDKVEVVAKVDGYGHSGIIISIDDKERFPIHVRFKSWIDGVGKNCHYTKDELKLK